MLGFSDAKWQWEAPKSEAGLVMVKQIVSTTTRKWVSPLWAIAFQTCFGQHKVQSAEFYQYDVITSFRCQEEKNRWSALFQLFEKNRWSALLQLLHSHEWSIDHYQNERDSGSESATQGHLGSFGGTKQVNMSSKNAAALQLWLFLQPGTQQLYCRGTFSCPRSNPVPANDPKLPCGIDSDPDRFGNGQFQISPAAWPEI